MATTIQSAFDQFKQNLEITDPQTSAVSARQQSVRGVLEKNLNLLDSFLTGSYSRHTMVAPLNDADIDIFMVLENRYYFHYNGQNGGQAGLLDLVKRTLRTTYTRTPDISRNGQAVTIRFEDFIVDVVPAFYRQGGGFLIPNSLTQSWISTDPKKHVEICAQQNASHDGMLVPLIKMIKAWNRNIKSHFRSFHLEVLALTALNQVKISDFPSGCRFYFDKCRELIRQQNPDPAGYGGDVGNYISTQAQVDEAVRLFQWSYDTAFRAEDSARRYRIADAIKFWQGIFGDHFPAYG